MKSKIMTTLMAIGMIVTGVVAQDGKALAAKCVACHGVNFEKSALGKSGIVKGQPYSSIFTSLRGYKSGTMNRNGMGALMKGQLANMSDADMHAISVYISGTESDFGRVPINANVAVRNLEPDVSRETRNIKEDKLIVSNVNESRLQDSNELDRLLDATKAVKLDNKKWLFVVGIEKYDYTDNISYATRTAEMFAKVGMKKLGVPKENSFILLDSGASQAKIKTNLQKMLKRVKEGDTVYFYYNGHGIPVARQNFEAFMLAQDTEPDYVADEKFFALNNIYGALSGSKASKVVAFVDSCFSGVTDGRGVIKGVAATKMTPKIVNFDKEKMVVIAAGKGHQYSNGYDKKGYRLFSFFVMKNILTNNDNKDIGGLFKNIKNETYEASISEYGDLRTQEPTMDGNEKFGL